MINSAGQYVPTRDLLCQELDGEMVLLNAQSATYFSLNQTGTCIWRLLTAQRPLGEICQALAQDHDLPPERVMSDLAPFIEELLEAGLIRPAE